MVKIVALKSEDPNVGRVECRVCHAILEYASSDVKAGHFIGDPYGPTPTFHTIVCLNCRNTINVDRTSQ